MTNYPNTGAALPQAGAFLDKADLAVLLLHGRGASAEDILELGFAFHCPNVTCLAPPVRNLRLANQSATESTLD